MICCDGYRNGWFGPRPCKNVAVIHLTIKAPHGIMDLAYCNICKQGVLPSLLDRPDMQVVRTTDI